MTTGRRRDDGAGGGDDEQQCGAQLDALPDFGRGDDDFSTVENLDTLLATCRSQLMARSATTRRRDATFPV
jgi:hypothetical protein